MITAQIENYTDTIEEMKPLYVDHWKELGTNRDKVPLAPQYDNYLTLDRAGSILLATLRDDGNLVGYFVGFVSAGMHYETSLGLVMDIFWIKPEARNKDFGAVKLFRCAEKEARRLGVERMMFGSKAKQDAGRLFEYLGMEKADVYYTKWIGE